jgi:hypothetical protein
MAIVTPVVRLFFPCEIAFLEYDDESEETRWVLTRPLHTAVLPAGVAADFRQPEIWFYAQLVGGIGKVRLSVALSTEEGYWVKRSETQQVDFSATDPLTVHEVVFCMTNAYFPRPGTYEFKLLANHAELRGGRAVYNILTE